MKILLLEDDIALNKAIQRVLALDHHTIDAFFDGQTLMDTLENRYDLYILDINVPKISGLDILTAIMLQDIQAKVIMISSNTDMQSIQKAYDTGCVDYIKKPFHIAELRAKINRFNISKENLYTNIALKIEAQPLTKKEKGLLNLLLENFAHIVNYEMIDNQVYQDKSMTMDALRALVRRLRAKLDEDIIQNVIDEGYKISNLPKLSKPEREKKIIEDLESLTRENHLLKEEKEILLKKSTTDPLTGLYNRIKIQDIFRYEQEQFIQKDDPLSIILLDLDNFKLINDKYGHNMGDRYLQELAKTLTETFRTIDVIGRWGGEEFIVLLPQTSENEVKTSALKIQKEINNMKCLELGIQTASYGITTLISDDTLSTFIGRADEALLRAKANGKDRVETGEISTTCAK